MGRAKGLFSYLCGMEKFEVTILGCGSAKPSVRHFPSAQMVNFRDKLFLVDCGEGAQIQMSRNRARFSRLSGIFISHLHGDHCLGLVGLISSLGMLGRTAALDVFAPPQLGRFLSEAAAFFCPGLPYRIDFHPADTGRSELLYEDRSLSVRSVPLSHGVPCCGFLFAEKAPLPHIRRNMTDYYRIPHYAIRGIKEGAGWTTPEGEVVPHERLTTPSRRPRAYAYCSDTAYDPRIQDVIRGCDVLYHEATFADDLARLAEERRHSTARQAAAAALGSGAGRLVIGHYSSRYDDESILLAQAREVFPDTIAARENLVIEI